MNLRFLKDRCINDFGKDSGRKLFRAMGKIADLEFCVATGYNHNELSISKGCQYRGRIFKLTRDYTHLIMPDGSLRSLDNLSYKEIAKCLPKLKFSAGFYHCDADNKNQADPDEWLVRLGNGKKI
jgi:hypothetical protein